MIIQELRINARIVKLAAEIVLQRELLTRTRQKSCSAPAKCDFGPHGTPPVRNLVRYLSAISRFYPEPGARHVPMLLLNICSAWTDIALSTSTPWAAFLLLSRALRIQRRFCQFGLNALRIALCRCRCLEGSKLTRTSSPSFVNTDSD